MRVMIVFPEETFPLVVMICSAIATDSLPRYQGRIDTEENAPLTM